MSTQAYYKERLGFDPADTVAEHHREQRSQHGYEESLSKFKDERDAIQKKTFTKWVNKHLKKASRHVGDLFEDLRDGYNLISLLEVLSGEHLPRERGRMRFHMLQNVQMALDFLRYKKIKLVNIRAEDIVDGNPKLTLGLIWTIILHFQISDIVVGQEPNVTAREALLRWARRSTARYPGVRVTDFTGSWRDGLAFSALIHRNRPDLVDWRNARASQPRERLDRVFNVAEREYGVTRLLDPEDVDTPEPDEKSLITYISSLYDVFPEPPPIHPLYDAEAQRRSEEYRELASSLHLWIREKMCLMQERAFPPTLIEMKKLAADSTKFKNEEVPPRYRDKQRLSYLFRDLQKYFEAVGEVDIEAELHIEVIEKNWNRLMMLHQEREQAIVDEIKRLERLQRLAEKVHREMKSTDNRLEELERRVEDEARRLDRLHPLEAKHAVDLLEQDIRNTEIQIQNIFTDVHTLTEGRYSQAAELHKRVQKLHQRWVALRSLLHKRLVQPLSAVSFPVEERVVTKHRTTVHETRLVDTNPHFRSLHDCIDWCKAKIKQLQDADYGSDLPSVQNELDVHQKEHKNIEQFHPKVDRCVQAKSHFHGEESTLYSQHLAVLQKLYTELLAASNKRLSDLDTLLDFIQSATGELVWLSSKEETEVTRDWSDKNLNVQSIEQYYESLMSDLEKREIQFSAVQDRGEALVLQHHPAAKTIEAYMSAMQSQWAWLLQLTLCLEVHLKHAAQSQQFFRDVQQAEQWISKRDETLNTIYSQSDFSLDEGERLLKGMQELREELNGYGDHVQKLVDQAKDVVPMKQRRQPVTRPMQVSCVCSYKQVNMSIEKGEQCTLYDNSGRIKWRVKNQEGVETPVPGVCFALQPPDKDALEAAERLRRQYDRSIALWQRKQLRLRQNMIFATIKVVKGWDLPQFLAMGQDQRTAIRKALNEDAEKLLSEGDPADPQLRRLKREMAEVNKLFDELEKRARAEEESKNAGRIFNEQISALQQSLEEAERALSCRVAAPLPRDTDSLEHLVLQHKDLEQSLRRLAPDLDRVQQTFRGITLKTPAMRNKLDAVTTKWTQIWNSSNLYVERLKCVEIVLSRLEENTAAISELEVKLASFDELPSDIKGLQNVLEDLMVLQNAIAQQQAAMDQLNEDAHNARRLVEKSRSAHRGPHSDVDRLDDEVNRLNSRWTNICGQLVDRLRSAETAYALAQQLEHAYRNEVDFVDESYNRLEMENAKNLLNRAVERAPAIEAVNVTGGRLIREGKIYGQRLRAFKEQLEDICPSLDASVKKPRREFVSTVDDIARDLDTLNRRYTTLVDILQDRVRQLATQYPEDTSLQRALQEQRPLRTFRTEFNIYENSSCEERYTSTTTHYTQSQYSLERHERTERTERREISETIVSSTDTTRRSQESARLESRSGSVGRDGGISPRREAEVEEKASRKHVKREEEEEEASSSDAATTASERFSEIRSLKRSLERAEEGVGSNVIDARGIVDPRSGELLTVGEAINLRILDVRRGRITCSRDGQRKTVTIEEAAREKMIETRLADRLLGPCGYDEEGRPVSLLGAIQRELCDAEKADGVAADRAKVTYYRECGGSGRPAVADAMRDGRDDERDEDDRDERLGGSGTFSSALDPRTGEFVTETGERLSVEEAHARGYLAKLDATVTMKRAAVTLSDAMDHGLVDEAGRVLDRVTGEYHTLAEAVEKGILDASVKEVVEPSAANGGKISLREALDRGAIDSSSGKYVSEASALSLKEARESRLIAVPVTLKDCYDAGMMDERGRSVLSPAERGCKLSVREAMRAGILDEDRLRSVTDSRTGEMVTLREAVRRGLIDPERGTYASAEEEATSISEAVERGWIVSLVRRTIFDVDGFKDPSSGEYVSLNAALLKGLVRLEAGRCVYAVDPGSGGWISVEEAEERGYVRSNVAEMLNLGIGMARKGREMTLLEAVLSESIDPRTGMLLDRSRGRRPISLEDGIKRGLITPDGAALLTALLDIAVTVQTTTTKVREEGGRMEDTTSFEAMDVVDNVPRAIGTTTVVIAKDRVVPTSKDAKTRTTTVDPSSSSSSWALECKDPDQDQDTSVVNEFGKGEEGAGGGRWSTTEKRVFELPTDGWSLSEAIERRLFDPTTGLFIIPGTDRLVSFEECVKLRIIDPNSSLVIDPSNGRKVSLLRSLEKSILDSTGHYTSPRKITMKEAIDQGLVVLDDGNRTETETKYDKSSSSQHRLLRVTKVVGEPDKLEVTRSDDPSKRFEIKVSEAGHSIPDPVRVSRGLIYDPSTALVISTESGRSIELLQALSDGTLPAELVLVKDPATGRDIGITEAVQRGIVDSDAGRYNVDKRRKISLLDAAKFGIVSVIGSPLVPIASSTTPTKDGVPTYRTEVERVAREQALSPVDQEETSVTGKPPASVSISESDSAIGSTSVVDSATDFSPTAASEEPSVSRTEEELEGDLKFQYASNAVVVQRPSPETEIVLQKMRKRVMRTNEALETGLIDEETAEILTKELTTADGRRVSSLSDAIRGNGIDARRGRVVDPQRGDVLSIGEAVERGILDPVSGDVLVPLAKSLSIPGLYEQGLLDPREGKVVHPETGARLTLGEAILCEIVDPWSRLTCSDGRIETLRGAIESDLVDPDRSLIRTSGGGSVGLVKAVESRTVFAERANTRHQERSIPPAGMTFAVALERGLIDASGKEIRHPITEERLPLEEAIRGDFIMSLPCPVTSDSMEVTRALEAGLIDREKGVYVHPTTGTPVSLATAIESGLLVVKPSSTSAGVTETVTCHHTVSRRTVEISPGYELASGDQVRDLETGRVVGMAEARGMGIVREEGAERRERFTTKDIRTTFDRAFERGLLDMREGTFTDPSTGRSMPIGRAVESGLLEDGEESSRRVGGIERVYDEGTERFLDPETREAYTLSEAMDVGLVDPDTVIYDAGSAGTMTAREAVERGVIDPVTGRTREDQGHGTVSLKQAAKLGLLAVVAAPVLAGKAVYDAVRDARKDGVGEEGVKSRSRMDEESKGLGKREPVAETPTRGESRKESAAETSVEERIERDEESKKELVSRMDVERERVESGTKVERVEPKKEAELKMDVDGEQVERKKEAVSKVDGGQVEPEKKLVPKIDPDREEVGSKKEAVELKKEPEQVERKKEPVSKVEQVPERTLVSKMDVDEEQVERKKEAVSKDDVKQAEPKKEPVPKVDVDEKQVESEKEPVSRVDVEQAEPKKEPVSKIDGEKQVCKEESENKERVETKKEPVPKLDIDKELIESKKEFVSEVDSTRKSVSKIDIDKQLIESKMEFVSEVDSTRESVSKIDIDKELIESKKEFVSEMDIDSKKEFVSKVDIAKERVETKKESVPRVDIDKELIESKEEFVPEMDVIKESVSKLDIDKELTESKKESVSNLDIDKELTESKKESVSNLDIDKKLTESKKESVSNLDIDKEPLESKKESVPEIDLGSKKEFVDVVKERVETKKESKLEVEKEEVIESKKEFASEMDATGESVSKIDIDKELESKKEFVSEVDSKKEFVVRETKKEESASKPDEELTESKKEFASELDVTRETVSKIDKEPTEDQPVPEINNEQQSEIKGKSVSETEETKEEFTWKLDENLPDIEKEAKVEQHIGEERVGKEAAFSYTEKRDAEESTTEEEDRGSEESEEEERSTIRVTADLTAGDLVARGAFDPEKEKFVDPETGEVVSFHDFVLDLGIFDPDHVLVKDLSRKTIDRYVSLREAIAKPLVDRNLGYMVDPKTGKRIPFFDAVRSGLIKERPPLPDRPATDGQRASMTLRDAIEIGLLDPSTRQVRDPTTDRAVPLNQAIQLGLIDPNSIDVRDPVNDELSSLQEVLESGARIDVEEAFVKGLIVPESRKPISLEAAIRKGLYDEASGKMRDLLTEQLIDVEESVRRGIIDPVISECADNKAGTFVSLEEALREPRLFDSSTGRLRDTRSGESLALSAALDKGLITTSGFAPTLIDAIVREYYCPRTGLVSNPRTGEETTLREALETDYVDGATTVVRDDRSGEVLSLREAGERRLIDLERGILTRPHSMTLNVAYEKGYILSTVKPWSLQQALAHQTYDPDRGLFVIDGVGRTLEDALKSGLIARDSPSVKDPRSSEIISLGEAIEAGLIEPRTGTALDPSTGGRMSLTDAVERGLVVPAKRKISLPEAVFKGLYEPTTGRFIVPETSEKLQTDRAIKVGAIDPSTAVVVRQPHGRAITFSKAIKELIVDPKTGTVTNEKGKPIDFREALERGLLLEARRPMTFSEAISKGILDERTNKFLDPQTGLYLSLIEAVKGNLIDADSVTVRSGFRERICLTEAIRSGYIDGSSGRVRVTADSSMSLREAYEAGLIVDHRAAVSLQRAIHQGLYDDRSGKITDPSTGRAVTLHEAMRNCLVSPVLPCYWDKRAGRLLSLAETCRAGVIDRRSGMFRKQGSSGVTLTRALQAGLIVDIESPLCLHQAIAINVYEPGTGAFHHPATNRKLSLAEACDAELIDPYSSIVKDARRDEYVPLCLAISSKLVDDTRGTYLALPPGQPPIDLREAASRGYVVPSSFPLPIQAAVDSNLYRRRPEAALFQFVDPRRNETHNLATAFEAGLLDPTTTALKDGVTGQLVSMERGMESGAIDAEQCQVLDTATGQFYPIDVAFSRGLLIALDRPLARHPVYSAVGCGTRGEGEAERAEEEEEAEEKVKVSSLKKAIEDGLVDARTAVVRDPDSGRFVAVGDALEEGRILDPSWTGTFGRGEARLVRVGEADVYLAQPLGLEEVVGKGLLDGEGRVVDSRTRERVTLREAVRLGIVDPESAVIKDTRGRRLVRLEEAFKRGLMDAEKGNVLETETSRLYALPRAIEAELLITPSRGFSLIDALQFGLYHADTGKFRDPFRPAAPLSTLKQAIDSASIDPTSTVIKVPGAGKIVSLLEAINAGIVDPIAGKLIEDPSGKRLDFANALEQGYILTAEARQAVEEKYKLCDETSAKLLKWISEVEEQLANQENAKEDIEELRNQITAMNKIKVDLEAHSRPVSSCLDQIRQVVLTGGNVLSSEEVSTLEKNGRSLKTRFDKASDRTERMVKRLNAARDELVKFKNELSTFSHWLEGARRILEKKEHSLSDLNRLHASTDSTRDFISDVIAHQADLRFITMAAQKFVDEGKEFLHALNEFRAGLPQPLPAKESTPCEASAVRGEVSLVSSRYKDLLARANLLSDKLSGVGGRQRDYRECVEKARGWLREMEPKVNRAVSEATAAEPKQVEEQLARVKALNKEMLANERLVESVRSSLEALLRSLDLVNAGGEQVDDASHLRDEADELAQRANDLRSRLEERYNRLESAATAVGQFYERAKAIGQQVAVVEKELDSMRASSREVKALRAQMEEAGKAMGRVGRLYEEVSSLERLGERLVDYGVSAECAAVGDQVEQLKRQVGRLDERSRDRHHELSATLDKLQEFHRAHGSVMAGIEEASERVRRLKPVGSEVESIKAQQEDFRLLKGERIEPLARSVDDCNGAGQALIQTAGRDVSTANIERDLDRMNERWNELKEKLNERDRRLDVGLLQSGKFQEALDGLQKWLADTEEMVSNQKPPSSDYKVIKAQLQGQKFLKKMLMDRQNSMSSLYNMGQEVAGGADPKERKTIEKQLKELVGRFDNLTESAAERMEALEQAMGVAKQFQDKLVPLSIWLDKTEKRVRDMELVPTDEEKIQQRVAEHDALHEDILSRKPDFSELTEIASQLMALVGEDEAAALADKLQDAADRYAALVERSEALGGLLQRSRQGLRHLVLSYQELQAWMEGMEIRLAKYRVLAVHTEKLLQQMEDLADLTEEVSSRQTEVDSTTDAGLELMKHISSDEALQLKDKLDSLQRRFNDLVSRGSDLLKHAQESLPLVQQFHDNHNRLMDWMQGAESALQSAEPREDEIVRLEMEISEYRPVLDKINAVGPQLAQLSPGEGAATVEALVTRDNRRFDAIAEQIQRKAERIQLSKQRSLEVIGDIDDLLEWFREVDNQLREAEPPSSEPEIIRVQLKEHKALNDDISSQKGRVRDVISTAKKVIRENSRHEDTSTIRENMEDLRETMEIVSGLSADRLGALEQALPLAEHLRDTHVGLVSWLEEAEQQVAMLPMPALRPDLIVAQQDKNELLVQSINEHKPLVEKLNKTGEALIKLCNEEEGMKIQDILEADTARYAALRAELRSRQQTLEQALQESSQFSDKLEGMLRALSSTADQVNGAEPISAHPGRLRDQMEENSALIDELAQRSEAYAAVKRAADDVISKAGNRADPAVKDIKRKLEKLNKLWADVQKSTTDRSHTLDDALQIAEKFWSELNGVMSTLRELQDALAGQAPPAAQPAAIQQQQVALQEIRHEIDQTKPDVEQVRASGHELMGLCGEPDKPEVRKHIEDLDQAWDNVTALYARREENLIDAMEKAMEFHETLQNLLEFLEEAEEKFARMGPLGSDIDEVKKQIKQLANFKAEVDPHMVKVEALNRQAAELTERTSSEQAAAIKEPLGAVNKRWDGLLRGLVERQRLLENALLRLGQFQHALDELLVWIEKTDDTLDNLKAVAGDPQVIEVELAKLKVLVNDIQAHQTSVDTLNDAGRQLIEDGKGTAEASTTAEKLGTLNRRWRDLLQRAADRQRELEDALREAQSFTAEIQDLLSWLGDVDNTIVASKPVGGLPETATEQLERFMEVYNELEQSRGKVETVLQQGQEYLKRADSSSAGGLSHNLKTLKQRWDNVTARANDKKIKLEIALREATEFHDALQVFVDWLTNAEKILMNLKPVSRVMETILGQIEEHKAFQKDVGTHRETMLNLDKKGTHLKYFSQKQDVILIKNLLISVQHRWERVVSKSAERTRALDHGYKEAREFHDAWSGLMNWLDETERILDEVAGEGAGLGGNDPEKIKARLNKHRELQKALSAKQGAYDTAMKNGKSLKDKAPKSDELALKELLNELKNKWTTVCGKCVDRQRKLEEALLFSGQFKDAVQALLEWLVKSEKQLANTGPLFGDLDTVMNLVEQHKTFEKDLESRATQMESVIRTGRELLDKATQDDAAAIGSQLAELNDLWDTVTRLSSDKTGRLEAALREAERLHKAVHVLLEWLSDAEMKLRFAGQLPEDEQESRNQLMEHEKFLRELRAKEVEKEQTLELAHTILAKAHPDGALVIKHWITIIQSRWEEVSTWAQQRNQRLENHMRGLQDLDNLLEELLSWLEGLENTLNTLEAEPLPDDKATLEMLIGEHREFMESTSRRQDEVDRVCKARQIKSAKDTKKITKAKSPAPTRASPGRERTPDSLPHIGPRFPPKGSKGAEPEFRSPRVKLLWDRWRHVWMLAWERQRRLQDKYNYIQELDRVANFSWEDWRKRFLKFMNHKKSRLTDLFRKMDKNNDGLIPREDFIQGIMNTKFETSRLEMGAVADLFDQHGEGLIDWKEFIAALRPDWEERRTYNDTDKIHDEVKRLVMLCTCRQKFRVFQVGEGKYRFGDSQKLRLVRILRSTVMVRVGGGWVALDEFLLKNDPCRAKGRTNIELREQFILADGVSQTMTAFRSKPSPTSTLQRTHISSASAGPITKVRERSARSVPMGQSRASRSSLSAGTPDSLSDNESSFKIASARKSSTPYRSTMTPGGSRPSSRPASRPASRPTSRPGSRPASRQGSKPPSRYGSTQSLDSTDESTNVSRIPRRTAVSTTGNTPTSSRHNSVSGKRLGTPVNGSSSRPRTPTGLVSPASGVPSRTRTPSSGSSTPLPPSLKLSRKPSGASDTSVSTTTTTTPASHRKGKPTPVDQRAPFRL